MRHLNKFMVLLNLSLVTIISCSSSDDGGGDGDAASGTLKAQIGGKSYQSMGISSSATVPAAGSNKNLIIITSNSDGNAISMTIFGYEGGG